MKLNEANRKILSMFVKNMHLSRITLKRLDPKTIKLAIDISKYVEMNLLEETFEVLFEYVRLNNMEKIKVFLHSAEFKTFEFTFQENFEENFVVFKAKFENHFKADVKPRKKDRKHSKYNKSK